MADAGPGSAARLRQELLLFAQGLDEATRAEVIAALDDPDSPASCTSDARPSLPSSLPLSDLSRILLRLSQLVTRQQARLVALFQELQHAMRHQDVLQALQQELAVARRLQQSILPRQAPALEGIELDAVMEPASEVGGDFYDYFMIDDEHLALVVGDVSGKGVPAAFFMAIARTLLRAHALTLRDPSRVLAALNEQLCADNDSAMFVTLVFAVLHVPSGRLHWVNAGHPSPLLKSVSQPTRSLAHKRNPGLGIQPGLVFQGEQSQLSCDDFLVFYTDGIVEARNDEGREFGVQRLRAALTASQRAGGNFPHDLLARVRRFERHAPAADDITCLALKYRRPVRSSGSRLSTHR